MKRTLIVLCFAAGAAAAALAQTPAFTGDRRLLTGEFREVEYDKILIVPKTGTLTVEYDSLYPGERLSGGCSWDDLTKPGSFMPLLRDDKNGATLQAPRGHRIHQRCHWIVKNPKWKPGQS